MMQWMHLAERLAAKPTPQQRTREQLDFPVDKYHRLVQTVREFDLDLDDFGLEAG